VRLAGSVFQVVEGLRLLNYLQSDLNI